MTDPLRFCGLLLLLLLLASPTAAAEAPDGVYRYAVSHSLHGEVGSFTNEVRRTGGETVVDSRLRIAAGLLGVVLHRVQEDRREVWRDGRLVAYESRADDNGTAVITRGRAEGDRFVIEGPDGRRTAAPDLYTTNPWSSGIVAAHVLMGTQRGDLNHVTVNGGALETVDLGDRTVAARHYSIRGDVEREIWFDRAGTLVKLSFPAAGGTVTFALAEQCGPPEEQAAASTGRC